MRARLVVLLAMAVLVTVACGTATTPRPTDAPAASAAPAGADATPQATATDTATATPAGSADSGSPSPASTAGGRWVAAGTMANGAVSHAIRLPDGRVLTLAEGGSAEIWDPAGGGTWHQAPGLPKWRGEFAAVALSDGRVLVTGGENAGKPRSEWDCPNLPTGHRAQSYSSTYILDPNRLDQGWVRAGLLGTARTAPSVALLPDGRVLVAGGYYLSGESETYGAAIEAQVVAYRATPSGPAEADQPPRADVDPGPPIARALATAELFDPTTGEWSTTGPMKYARFGAPAVTLSDGRVLVVSSIDGYEYRVSGVEHSGEFTTEIFDPATGRFTTTGYLGIETTWRRIEDVGTLVALRGGKACLVGVTTFCKSCPWVSSDLVFDAQGRGSFGYNTFTWGSDEELGFVMTPEGVSRSGAAAAALPDGRVLEAGGGWSDQHDPVYTASAELGDPATYTWEAVSPMPEPRAGALAVGLADGSVLVVGGRNTTTPDIDWETCTGPFGLTSAIRYLPGP